MVPSREDYGWEGEGVRRSVRLSESVPARAIKSGRGVGGGRVLKRSLRVGFCLVRAVSGD